MKKENLQEIMFTSWEIVKKTGCSIKEAMIKSWKSFKLKQSMLNMIVSFSFVKSSGELRDAKGTLMDSVIPELKGSVRKSNYSVQTFFDVEVNGWRSFSKISLL